MTVGEGGGEGVGVEGAEGESFLDTSSISQHIAFSHIKVTCYEPQ